MNHAHDFLPDRAVAELPPLHVRFCVPRLADKPQNPIMDTLKLLGDLKAPPAQSTLLNRREAADRATDQPVSDHFRVDGAANLWQRVCDKGLLHEVRSFWPRTRALLTPSQTNLRSWDTWQSSQKLTAMYSPYISEQASHIFVASRHLYVNTEIRFMIISAHLFNSVKPQLSDATTQIIYVKQSELLGSLRLTLMGATSDFHVWDPQQECFILRGVDQDKKGILSIVGRDETMTQRLGSLITRNF
jgi:hypothetical protein